MTQQVAWNIVSNQKRTLIHRRALAAKEILLKALLFFSGCFPGAGRMVFAFQPTVFVTQRPRSPGRRGQKTQMWGEDGVSVGPACGSNECSNSINAR